MDESGCRDLVVGDGWRNEGAGEDTYGRAAVLPLMRRQPRLASIFGTRKSVRFPCAFSEDFVANQKREKF